MKYISLKGKKRPYSLVPPKPCAPAVYCTQPVSPIFQLLFVPCTILWQKCMCEMVMCKVCPQFDRLTAEKSCRSFFFLFNPELDLFQQHLVWMFLSYFRYWLLSFLQFCSQLQPLRPMCFFTRVARQARMDHSLQRKIPQQKKEKKEEKTLFSYRFTICPICLLTFLCSRQIQQLHATPTHWLARGVQDWNHPKLHTTGPCVSLMPPCKTFSYASSSALYTSRSVTGSLGEQSFELALRLRGLRAFFLHNLAPAIENVSNEKVSF